MSEEVVNSEAKPESAPDSPWGKVFWLFVILIVAGLAVFGGSIWLGKQTIDATKETVESVAKIFRPNVIVETFHEWKELEVTGNEGNILEVATAVASEDFSRTTNVEMFGKVLPLGKTVSEISVPATYRFHIDLNGDWFLESDGSRLMVLAPKLQPSLPVAFDTGKMRKKTKSGWARWDGDENLDNLERSLTAKLNQRAGDKKTIAKARDESRQAVAKFLQRWLLSQSVWEEGKFEEIVVIFEDEKDASLMNSSPTIELKGEISAEPKS